VSELELVAGYIQSGIEVFPLHGVDPNGRCTCGRECPSPAKHPVLGLAHPWDDPARLTCRGECGRLGHGLHDATTDPGQVSEWLGQYGQWCNWGIRPPVGIIVLDVDPRNGGDVELRKLEQKHGTLPTTLTAQTGSGGLHHWLAYDGPTRGKLCKGVDVKTNTGYLVAPPSRHIAGGSYFWLETCPAAYAPDWVKVRMNPPKVTRPPLAGPASATPDGDALVRFVESRPYGEINDAVYWAAARADQAGALDEEMVEKLVAAAGRAAGSQATPQGESQTRRTIGSAARRDTSKDPAPRRQLPSLPEIGGSTQHKPTAAQFMRSGAERTSA
jgi:hypothetical protein